MDHYVIHRGAVRRRLFKQSAEGRSRRGRSAVQKIVLGRIYQHQTATIDISETTLAGRAGHGEIRVVRRTTTLPVRNIKPDRPRPVTPQVV